MAKGGNSLSNKRSRNSEPYDANNSFVKKVATKVTDLIPQRSWISKWFNSSQDNGEILNDMENPEDSENEQEPPKPPPSKRPRIRMDVTHPPGTFDIQPRNRTSVNEVDHQKEQYSIHSETTNDFLEPPVAGTSGVRRLVASTPAVQPEIRSTTQTTRSEFISLTSTQNNGVANGTDDNSESSESTSGCSSLIPQINRQEAPLSFRYNKSCTTRKRYMDDKLNFTNHLQSPRSLFLDSNPRDSLSSRRPSFNASLINNSLERGPSYASPFYNGNTTFGGANTAGLQRRGRTLFNSTNELQLKVPNRTNVQVKSPNAAGNDSSGMSQTAKRILEALEHFSSPILDAKKIPMNTSNNSSPLGGRKRQRDESGAPSARVGLRHLTRELTIPTVPELMKLRRRQRLQDTTVAARKIVSAHSAPAPTPQEYRLRSSDDEKSRYSSKIKTKDKNNIEEDFIVDAVNLPNVALPINTLPTFDIMLPINANNKARVVKDDSFKFASPIKVTDTTRNLKSINNFTFSKPINADDENSFDDSRTLSKTVTLESDNSSVSCLSGSNFMWSNSSTAPKAKETYKKKDSVGDRIGTSSELKTGSVMDILGKNFNPPSDPWKSTVGMWECNQCLVRNPKDKMNCVACKASKSIPKVDKTTTSSSTTSSTIVSQSKPVVADCFGSQFKMSTGQWECDACLVRNKQTDVKCVACTTPRPGSVKPPQTITPTSNVIESGKSDLMEKFKPPAGSWECPGCMLRNPGGIETCPCCNASKPGSLKVSPKKVPANSESFAVSNSGDNQSARVDFTKKSTLADGFWECLSCKLKNPSSVSICPCASKSNSIKTVESGFGDKFKKPEGAWTCDDCMLQNKAETSECIACGAAKPGSKKVTKSTSITGSSSSLQFSFGIPENAGGFKFGVDKTEEKQDTNKTPTATSGFTFGVKSDTPKAGGFTFGVPQNSSGFTFGITNVQKNKSDSKTDEKDEDTIENVSKKRSLNTEEPKTVPSFSFGIPKSEETKPATEKSFTFGARPPVTVVPAVPISLGGIKTDSTADKINEPPKVNFAVPNKEPQKINFSSSHEKSINTMTNDKNNLFATKSSSIDVKPVNPTFGMNVTNVAVTIRESTITTTVASTPAPSLFTFGAPTTTPSQSDNSAGQTFGQNSVMAPPTTTPASSVFTFGSIKPGNATTIALPEKSPVTSFATPSSQVFNNSNATPNFEDNKTKPTPAFGVADSKVPSPFGSAETKASVFGAPDNKVMAFGSAEKTTGFTPATPAFGVTSATPAFGSTTPAFGTAPTPAFGTNSTPSGFAATKPTENAPAPVSGLFTFGGNATQPTPQSSAGFSFSGNNPAPTPAQAPVQKSLFTFGNTANTQQPGGGFGAPGNFNTSAVPDTTPATFAFNAPKPDAPTPAFAPTAPITTPMFGAPQSTPSFDQNQTTQAFGSVPTPAPSTGFNFGSSAPVASSGFNFGGPAPAAPAAGGFTFNAPSSSPAVAFDPNTRPTFNFTGGSAPTAFNATPQAAQQRKFKKAVRRTQPR